MHAPFALVLVAAAALPAAEMLLPDAGWRTGPGTVGGDGVQVGDARLALDRVPALRLHDAVLGAAGAAGARVVLVGGDTLAGRIASFADDVLMFESGVVGAVSIPAAQVRAVILAGGDPGPGPAGVVLANGDVREGAIVAIDDALVLLKARRVEKIPRERVAAVRLAAAAPTAPAGAAIRLRLVSGDLISAGAVQAAAPGALTVRTGLGDLALRVEAIDELWAESPALRPLSALAPTAVNLPAIAGTALPLRADVGLDGRPLAGGGRRYVRGLSLPADGRVEWTLDRPAAALLVDLAIDDAVPRPDAAAISVVRAGGREVLRRTVRAGQAAQTVRVPLGAKDLSLAVEADPVAGDAGAWIAWGRAILCE